MKYKVGDKVRVRKDLVVNNEYNGVTYINSMDEFKDEKCVITNIRNQYYQINNFGYWWSEEMFESIDDEKVLEYALRKLGMTKEELEDEMNINEEDITFIKKYMENKKERREYCEKFNSVCDSCKISNFKDKYKSYGNVNCDDIYRYLKEKGEI